MPRTRTEPVTLSEAATQALPQVDFSDCFATTNHHNTLEEIAKLVFDNTPSWVRALFRLRNKLASLVGLKSTIPPDYNTEFRVGGYISFFKLYSIAEQELIMGANDTHLNFRAIITNTGEADFNIKLTTLVQYNNLLGKVYMAIVRPFHVIVVKRMLAQAHRT